MTPEPTQASRQDTPAQPAASAKRETKKIIAAKEMVEAKIRQDAEQAIERIVRDQNENVYYMTCTRSKGDRPHIGIIFTVNPHTVDRFYGPMWYAFYHGVNEDHQDAFHEPISDIICQDCYANHGQEKVQLRVYAMGREGRMGETFGILPRHKQQYILSMKRAELQAMIDKAKEVAHA